MHKAEFREQKDVLFIQSVLLKFINPIKLQTKVFMFEVKNRALPEAFG